MPNEPRTEIMRSETQAPMLLGSVNIEMLIAKALEKESALEVLDKLMVMRREMQADAARAAYFQALSDFQSELPIIPKTKPVYEKGSQSVRYHYAPLSVIQQTIRPYLKNNGLSYRFHGKQPDDVNTEAMSGMITAKCEVYHIMGHSEISVFQVPIDPKAYMTAQQKVGSADTFAKRYALCNALGIVPSDDDDSEMADPDKSAGTIRKPVKMPTEKPDTPKETFTVEGVIERVGYSSGKKKNGQLYEKYGIFINGIPYNTFSQTLAKKAKELAETCVPVILTYEVNGDYKNVVKLEENIPEVKQESALETEQPPVEAKEKKARGVNLKTMLTAIDKERIRLNPAYETALTAIMNAHGIGSDPAKWGRPFVQELYDMLFAAPDPVGPDGKNEVPF